jgi:DNA-binding transcriptional ArsR family regulator
VRSAGAAARLVAAAPVFAALGDETRLRLVARLTAEGPLSIARLTEESGVTRQAVTKHLVALEGAGIVSSSRAGRERVWELRPRRLDDARRHLDRIALQWERALERLRDLVELPAHQ